MCIIAYDGMIAEQRTLYLSCVLLYVLFIISRSASHVAF